MEKPEPFNPLTQAFQDLYDNSASFTMTALPFALTYPNGTFKKLKTKEEQDSFLKKYFLKFDKFGSGVISSMNTFSEEFKKSILSKEEVQFINSRFKIVVMEFVDFICMFNANKDNFSEDVQEKLGFYYDKMRPFFNELWTMVDEHNAKNPDNKLMTVLEARDELQKERYESINDDD